ncbi:MAG: transcription termination/antitermination protein NusG [Parcubacteria group bacterium CG08_land_8_20_14_0_20_43_9]|nr:MAG: transcription termination/antitermination protein NusG [Parcubacteria group bacterium CG08_land_8_20_14_0_20_43_9]
MPKQKIPKTRQWYVLHTYSGYEDSVAKNLKHRVESLGMEDKIFNVLVPKEKKIKIKGGKRKATEEKIYPGYVLVEMIVTDDSWYVVRNTPNVTGFVGAGTTPVPVSPDEISEISQRVEKETPKYAINIAVGDTVKITDGPFKEYEGKVSELDQEQGKIKVMINLFGRDTPVELDSLQVKKI